MIMIMTMIMVMTMIMRTNNEKGQQKFHQEGKEKFGSYVRIM